MATETNPPVPEPVPPDPEPAPAPVVVNLDRAKAERTELQKYSGIRQTRAELVYGPRNEFGFLSDGFAAARGDHEAYERQERHYAMLSDVAIEEEYAGDVLSSEIPGAYPSLYLPGLFTPRILKGRPMASFYDRFSIDSGAPRIFPKVTTSTTVAVQSAEAVNPAASDFATTSVTVTPLLYGAETVVSRQVLDGANPGAERMILQDMLEAYAQASEAVVKTAVEAGATASGTAITAATPFAGVLGNALAYYTARFKGAGAVFVPAALYAVLAAQVDTTGRPLLPNVGLTNSDGQINAGGTSGSILSNVLIIPSYASTANVVVTGRSDDYAIFESNIARFSYDNTAVAPAAIRVGLWAYLVVGTRLGSLKVTAA